MDQILLLIFVLTATILLTYSLLFLKTPFIEKPPDKKMPLQGVTIIVCAKNEAENLEKFLPFILQQDYPDVLWELLVINDRSTDTSASLLNKMIIQFPQLKVIHIEATEEQKLPGKKDALDKGIQAAKFENILLTDADCYPTSNQWLRQMLENKTNAGKKVVLGYGRYEKENSLLNRFIRWETIHTAIQYFSYSQINVFYMGVGRNLMYEKQLYINAKNDNQFWELYQRTPSGDDDLLISHIANKENTGIFYDLYAQTISASHSNWKTWLKQKSRHLSTGKYYSTKTKFILSTYAFSHSLFWILGFILLLKFLFIGYLLGLFILATMGLLRVLVSSIAFYNWSKALHEKNIIAFNPMGDVAWSIYNVILSPYIFWKNKQQWK